MFLVKGVAGMPEAEADGAKTTTTEIANEESESVEGKEKLVHFTEGAPENEDKPEDSVTETEEERLDDVNESLQSGDETVASVGHSENRTPDQNDDHDHNNDGTSATDGDETPPNVNVYAPE